MICKYNCNGCSSQHIDYNIETENKKKILQTAIGFSEIKLFIGQPFFYRNRIELILKNGKLCQRGKNGLVKINECIIANERINSIIKEINEKFESGDGDVIIRTSSSQSTIIFNLNEEIKKNLNADNIIINGSVIKGSSILKENYLGKNFEYSALGFFQNNYELAVKMHEYCRSILEKYKNYQLLDLYAGVGTFGIINADLFKEVIIIESFKDAVECAKKNIGDTKNIKVLCLEAKSIGRLKFDDKLIVITDPPRTGMEPKTIDTLKKIKPEAIIYVSCNVEKLGKDVKKFKDYYIKSAALFDFFPHTKHFESVVEMVRK